MPEGRPYCAGPPKERASRFDRYKVAEHIPEPLARRRRSTGVSAGVATAIVGTSCRNWCVWTSPSSRRLAAGLPVQAFNRRPIGTDGDVRRPVGRRDLRDPAGGRASLPASHSRGAPRNGPRRDSDRTCLVVADMW